MERNDPMPGLPKRKKLRLENYDYSSNGSYFITISTKDRKQILSEIILDNDQCARVSLKPCGSIAESYIKTIPGIDKYVIMPNHIHMIIHKTDGRSLVSDMRAYKSLVSKKTGRSIWQDSYYDHVIRNSDDYLEKWQYIDENPAKWADDEYNAD